MSDIVFLVESIDRYGQPYTLSDRLKSLSPEWIEHYNSEILKTYINCIGKKITFQAYHAVENFDPNKKYYYFICLDHFNFDFPVFFQMLGKSKLKRLHDNNIPLLFAHDLETIPHLEYTAFVKQLEWLFLMRGVYSGVENEIIVLNAGEIVPRQAAFIKQWFYNKFKFIQSPLLLKYSANELCEIYPAEDELERLNGLEKERQFTCLNRTPRFHRSTLIHGLKSQNLDGEGFISNGHLTQYNTHSITSETAYATAVKNQIVQNNGSLPVMTLDEYTFTDNRPKSLPAFPEQLWKTYYDIVSETGVVYFYPDPLDLSLITEKTVKSILMMRPFMINGGPYSLKSLKRFGFKTYDFLFDENHDDVENLIDRQEIIVQNVRNYVNKYSELSVKINAHRDVVRFNRHRLLNVDYEQLLANELMSVS
jgi:hypothetical protein